jgi:putative transcriptional regulator
MSKRNIEQEIIDGVRAIKAGLGREFSIEIPDRQIPKGVKELRASMGLSQAEFARRLNISIKTLQQWEQGIRKPRGTAISLLNIVSRYPELFLDL